MGASVTLQGRYLGARALAGIAVEGHEHAGVALDRRRIAAGGLRGAVIVAFRGTKPSAVLPYQSNHVFHQST